MRCRCCDKPTDRILNLNPSPLANDFSDNPSGQVFPLQVDWCEVCGHAQLSVNVDRSLYRDYQYVSGFFLEDHFRAYAHQLKHMLPIKTIVDVGSNDGMFLRQFPGAKTIGVEPCKAIAGGTDYLYTEFLTPDIADDIAREHGFVDVVTANNVFAHTDSPQVFLQAVKKLIGPFGMFVFEVNNSIDIFDNCLFDTIYHEHVDYFSPSSAYEILDREDLSVARIDWLPTQGGSMRVYASELTEPAVLNFRKPSSITSLRRRIDDKLSKLTDLVGNAKTIGGIGAPAKSTTFLNEWGRTIDFLVDESPLKIGKKSPHGIPVIAPDDIRDYPDVWIAFAWNTGMAKRDWGAPVIVPHPEPHYV